MQQSTGSEIRKHHKLVNETVSAARQKSPKTWVDFESALAQMVLCSSLSHN